MGRLAIGLCVWAGAALLLGAAFTLAFDMTPDDWGWAVWLLGSWLVGVPLTAPLVAITAVLWGRRRRRAV